MKPARASFRLFSVSLLALALALASTGAPLLQAYAAQAGGSAKSTAPAFTLASLKGLYAYANLAEIKASYGMLELDGRGNVKTDNITLNVPGEVGRVITPLGPGTGTYSINPSGLGQMNITFATLNPPRTFTYEFVIRRAVRESQGGLLATEVFSASATTGVANATVTYLSPMRAENASAPGSTRWCQRCPTEPIPVAKFNRASLKGSYAYSNNADFASSYGVLVFDGSGNVRSDGKLSVNVPAGPNSRDIKRIGPGVGTYAVDATGRGYFEMYFEELARSYRWEFVITQVSRDAARANALATGLFGVITTPGVSGQLVAPVLTLIVPP